MSTMLYTKCAKNTHRNKQVKRETAKLHKHLILIKKSFWKLGTDMPLVT